MPNLSTLNKARAKVGVSQVVTPKAPPKPMTAAPTPILKATKQPAKVTDPTSSDYSLPGSGNPVYTTKAQLDAALRSGKINSDQYTKSTASLKLGGKGVDPLGFGNVPGVSAGMTIEDLTKKANDEYIQNGSVSRETEAALERLNDPSLKEGGATPSGRAGIRQPTPTPAAQGSATIKTAPKMLTGADLQAEADKRRNKHLSDLGISDQQFKEVNDLLKQGYKYAGTENNQPYFMNAQGQKVFIQMNESATDAAIKIAGKDYATEIQSEQNDAADALKAQQMGQQNANNAAVQETVVTPGAKTDTTTSSATSPNTIPDIDETIAKLTAMTENSSGISQEVYSAYLPSILNRLAQVKKLRTEAEKIDTPEEQAAIVEERIAPEVALATRREDQFNARLKEDKRIQDENKQIALEANSLAVEANNLDKQIVQLRNAEDETKQAALNVEGQKQLRRSLNAAGIETSPLAQEYLQNKIQEAADHLSTMRQTNNLTLLKFSNVGLQLANNVKSILNDFDSKRATLYSTYDDNIFNLDEFVSGARGKAYDDIKKQLKELTDEEDKLFTEAGDKIAEAGIKVMEQRATEEANSKKDSMSTKDKLGFVSSLRSGINQNKTITQAKDVDGFYGAVSAGYDRYTQILQDMKDGKLDPKAGEVALGPAQSAVIGSLARILDPGSVVRNEEYERQTQGASFVNRVAGYWEKLKGGGAGVTQQDITEMKVLADKLHQSWESRLQQEMQPFILDIQDWNTNYPETPIDFGQVIPVDRIHLPETTVKTWESQSGWGASTDTGGGDLSFTTTGGPANGWRTDRHNNPIAFAVKAGGTNEFTDALDAAGIPWEHGDPFANNPGMVTVKVIGNPVEASRVVLSDTNALQNWYLQPKRPYAKALQKFGIKSNEDFKALPEQVQNEVIATIYKGEVGNGSLMASVSSDGEQPQYEGITFQSVGMDDDPVTVKPVQLSMGTGDSGEGRTVKGSTSFKTGPIITKTSFKYKVKGGGLVTVPISKKAQYDSQPDIYTPIS